MLEDVKKNMNTIKKNRWHTKELNGTSIEKNIIKKSLAEIKSKLNTEEIKINKLEIAT